MKDRIELLVRVLNLTLAQFADEIGVQKSSISHIISERNKPSLDLVQKILLRFTDVSTEWLMFGKGTMFIMGNAADRNLNPQPESGGVPKYEESDLFSQNQELNSIENKANFIDNKNIDINISDKQGIKSYLEYTESSKINPNIPIPFPELQLDNDQSIERIVIFYKNKKFVEYRAES